MNMFEVVQMFGSSFLIAVAALLVALSILVFVHEWGHYIIARLCGIRVEIFSIGFGKELWGFNDKHGTRWKVSAVPLGGYVKLFGDTDPASAGHSDNVKEGEEIRPMTKDELEVAFFTKPVWQRAAVVFAGPAINYIFAIFLLSGLYMYVGQPVVPPVASAVIQGSSADKAGLLPHDQILSIDGIHVKDFSHIRREMMVSLEVERKLEVLRDGKTIELKATPTIITRTDGMGFKSTTGVLGIAPPDQGILISQVVSVDGVDMNDPKAIIDLLKTKFGMQVQVGVKYKNVETIDKYIIVPDAKMNETLGTQKDIRDEVLIISRGASKTYINHTIMTAAQSAMAEAKDLTVRSLQAMGQIVTGNRSATELGGLPRIAAVAGDMAQQGLIPFILLIALLSVNLGLINLLPIPLLDGGHLLFYAVESVLGRPIPEQMQEYAFRAGMVFLVSLMAFANINDLVQLSGILEPK